MYCSLPWQRKDKTDGVALWRHEACLQWLWSRLSVTHVKHGKISSPCEVRRKLIFNLVIFTCQERAVVASSISKSLLNWIQACSAPSLIHAPVEISAVHAPFYSQSALSVMCARLHSNYYHGLYSSKSLKVLYVGGASS